MRRACQGRQVDDDALNLLAQASRVIRCAAVTGDSGVTMSAWLTARCASLTRYTLRFASVCLSLSATIRAQIEASARTATH